MKETYKKHVLLLAAIKQDPKYFNKFVKTTQPSNPGLDLCGMK